MCVRANPTISLGPEVSLPFQPVHPLCSSILVLSLVTELVGGTAGRKAIGHAKRVFTAAAAGAAVSLAVLAFFQTDMAPI